MRLFMPCSSSSCATPKSPRDPTESCLLGVRLQNQKIVSAVSAPWQIYTPNVNLSPPPAALLRLQNNRIENLAPIDQIGAHLDCSTIAPAPTALHAPPAGSNVVNRFGRIQPKVAQRA